MSYAERVVSPLKGGVDARLGLKTCIVGPNGAGKTAISQALKLALLGYVDDHEGKDGVSVTAAIAHLFSPDTQLLFSEVIMSDDAKFRWESSRKKGGGFTKAKTTQPYEVAFPFLELQKLMSGDQKAVRSWLEARAGGALTPDEMVGLVPPVQRADARHALGLFSERSPVDLAARLKKEASTLRRNATKQEKTIDSIVEGVATPLTDDEVKALREEQNALRVELAGGVSSVQHEQTQVRVDHLAGELVRLQGQIDAIAEGSEADRETAKLLRAAYSMSLKHLQEFGDGNCVVCRRGEADIKAALDHWGGLQQQYERLGARAELQALYDAGYSQIQLLAAQLKDAKVIDVAGLSQRIADIQGKLSANDVSGQAWKQAEAARKEVQSSRAVADTYTALARTWEKEGRTRLEQQKKSFEQGVSRYLPGQEAFRVSLASGRVGLLRGDDVHTSLSGAELSRVFMAILAFEGEGGSTPTIIEPEDRGWDPDTLAGVMKALTPCEHQVILMSTTLPTGADEGGIEGWTLILLP